MEDNLKALQNWAEQMKSQLGDYKKYMDNIAKDLPADEKEKFNKAFDDINIEEIQEMAQKSTMNIINHIKSKI
jgi:hypothetical protein